MVRTKESDSISMGNDQDVTTTMADGCEWQECKTLARGGPFYWCRDDQGKIFVKRSLKEPNLFWFSDYDYSKMLGLVLENTDGTPLGASGTGEVPANSLGALLEKLGKQRPNASYMAAIAVDEMLVDYEDLGPGPGRGIWLYPAAVGHRAGVFLSSEKADDTERQGRIDNRHFNEQQLAEPARLIAFSAESLRVLAKDVEAASIEEVRQIPLRFCDINRDRAINLASDLKSWENEHGKALYLYVISLTAEGSIDRCIEQFVEEKNRNVGGRRFARVNSNHNGHQGVLYVGSSKTIGARIKQHLGYSYPATYSLQIDAWKDGLDGGVRLEILRFVAGTPTHVLQAVEDALWALLKPAFGRQGSK